MPDDAADRFPEEALQALDFPEVLEWVAGRCQTPPGRRLLQEEFRPAMAPALLDRRRAMGQECLTAVRADAGPPLARGGDLHELLEIAGRRSLSGKELLDVAGSLECGMALRRWVAEHEDFTVLGDWLGRLPDCGALLEELRRVLDPRGEVRDEAHPDLGKLRTRLRTLTSERSREMDRIAEAWNNKGILRQRKPLLRSGRLLLAVRFNHQGKVSGVVHDTSQSGDTVFMEPGPVLALSNRLVDAQHRENQLVLRLLNDLSRRVVQSRADLERTAAIVAEVDATAAGAAWCREVEGVYPELPGPEIPARAEGVVELREARHPLLLRKDGKENIVPLTVTLGEDWDLLVVTGPNTGGKTVALKTVGVLAALARAGLPVTAGEGSRFPVLAGLDADIGDAQSIQSSLSTFSGHLRRILRILATARPGSLVFLDELGTGTDPEEGAALGRAVLEALLARRALVMATTHIGALKLFSLELSRAENASMEFDPETLQAKYRLLVGVPGASHALEVAQTLGLPSQVLARARELSRRAGEERVLAEVSRLRRDAEVLKEKARDSEAAARESLRRQESAEEQSHFLLDLRQQEAEDAYVALCRELETLLADSGAKLAGRLKGTDREVAQRFQASVLERVRGNELGERRRAFLASLKKGMVVYVPRFRERLQIVRVDGKKEKVKVRRGNLEIEVPMREITWVSPPPGKDPGG